MMFITRIINGMYELAILLLLLFIFFLPGQFAFLFSGSDIFPALDLILIFYALTNFKLKSWQIMIIGLVQDVPYGLPVGCSSVILLSTTYIYKHYYSKLPQGHYLLSFVLFGWFALSFTLLKICMLSFLSGAPVIFGFSVYFYFLNTIFSYPIMRYSLSKLLLEGKRQNA